MDKTTNARIVVLPFPFVLAVLGELTSHDPDILSSFLADFPPPDGKSYSRSMRNLTSEFEPEFYGSLLGLLAQLKDDPVILNQEPVLSRDYTVAIYIDDQFRDECWPDFKTILDSLPLFDIPFNPQDSQTGEDIMYGRCVYLDTSILYQPEEFLENAQSEEDISPVTALSNCFWDCAAQMLETWNPSLLGEH